MHMFTLSIDFLKHFACQCMAVFCGTYSPIMLIYFTPLGGNVSDDYMDFRAGHNDLLDTICHDIQVEGQIHVGLRFLKFIRDNLLSRNPCVQLAMC